MSPPKDTPHRMDIFGMATLSRKVAVERYDVVESALEPNSRWSCGRCQRAA